jgi:colanic acid/amylovoran biosynthesis glycosyltransferase
MKVLYLAPPRKYSNRLTAFTFMDEEIVALSRTGVEVFVLTRPVFENPSHREDFKNVKLVELGRSKSIREVFLTLGFLWRARRSIPTANWLNPRLLIRIGRIERCAADIVGKEGIDVIHSNFGWPSGSGGMLAKRITGRPLVTTLRGMDVLVDYDLSYGLRLLPFFDRNLRLLVRSADQTTHVSEFIRRSAIALGAREERAVTVLKGVDCEQFTIRHNKKSRSDTPMILTVGGLIRRKGTDCILRALGELASTNEFKLVVVGKGVELVNLRELRDALKLNSQVEFVGYVERSRIQELFAQSDIFVLGSMVEASGNVLLEALASGLPVICTDSGGPPEYIADGVTGFVVPVRDVNAMAAKIKILLDEPKLREKLGRASRLRAVEKYEYSRMINDILSVYQSVI